MLEGLVVSDVGRPLTANGVGGSVVRALGGWSATRIKLRLITSPSIPYLAGNGLRSHQPDNLNYLALQGADLRSAASRCPKEPSESTRSRLAFGKPRTTGKLR